MNNYYWDNLSYDLQDELYERGLELLGCGDVFSLLETSEKLDGYIHNHNSCRTVEEWKQIIEDITK
jgi:hypothetical protein